jgi:hypothetical protein
MGRAVTASGVFQCSVKSVGRAAGRSVVAAAAYRAGERLLDERTGRLCAYEMRKGVAETFIVTRDDAPAWAQDRGRLWNEAERAEPKVHGRLATELEVALPHQLSSKMRKAVATEIAREMVERYGVAADVAIHSPGPKGDHRNWHAHILITHRELGPHGFGEIANVRTRMRSRNGKTVEERVSGIAATPADVKAIRQQWEHIVNLAYERAGLDIRVDHRSHADRKIDAEPTKHLGPVASAMERRGEVSDRGEINRTIQAENGALWFDRDQANRDWEQRIVDAAIAHDAVAGAADSTRPRPPEISQITRQADEAHRRLPGHGDTPPIFAAARDEPQTGSRNRDTAPGPQSGSWMDGAGGAEALTEKQRKAAQRSYADWAREKPQLAKRHSFEHYVAYVQGKRAEQRAEMPQASNSGREEPAGKTALQIEQEAASRAAYGDKMRTERVENRIAEQGRQAATFGATVAINGQGKIASAPEIIADRLKPEGEKNLKSEHMKGAAAFAARLADEDITLARVTVGDAGALDALRQQEDEKRASFISARRQQHFAKLEVGDLAAITRDGNVHGVDPKKFGDAGQVFFAELAASGPLPGVIETRARYAREGERISKIWESHRSAQRAIREQRAAKFAKPRDASITRSSIKRDIYKGLGKTRRGGGRVARVLGGLADFVAGLLPTGGEPTLTPDQAKRTRAAVKEQRAERQTEISAASKRDMKDELLARIARQEAQARLRRSRGEKMSHDLDHERER